MQSIDDNSYILPAGGQQQFLCLSEVGHAGPGDELNIHILSILRSQLAKPDKLFRIAFFVLNPDIGEDVCDTHFSGGRHCRLVVFDIDVIRDTGNFRISVPDAGFRQSLPGLPHQLRVLARL